MKKTYNKLKFNKLNIFTTDSLLAEQLCIEFCTEPVKQSKFFREVYDSKIFIYEDSPFLKLFIAKSDKALVYFNSEDVDLIEWLKTFGFEIYTFRFETDALNFLSHNNWQLDNFIALLGENCEMVFSDVESALLAILENPNAKIEEFENIFDAMEYLGYEDGYNPDLEFSWFK